MAKPVGKPINVSLRVIADLSQGLYRSPADALKELVSNAYDADSPDIRIEFSADFSTLTIRDRGKGMTIDEFIEAMETIGGSSKRSAGASETTPTGRKIVGRIGIGLLSVSQIAARMEIESTVEGSSIGFRAEIEFDQFASEEARRMKITDLWEGKESIKIGNYYYNEVHGVDESLHYTNLKLTGLKRTILEKLRANQESYGYKRMMGTRLRSTKELVQWMDKNSVTKTALHEYDRIFWELCALCPVPYLKDALRIHNKIDGSSKTDEFTAFADQINSDTHFTLTVDGIECFKPLLMPRKNDRNYSLFFNLLFMNGLNDASVTYRDFDRDGNLIEHQLNVRGYLYFQRPKVWPPEQQGIIVRVRHVGVGQYDSTFMTYRRHEGFKFSQITGEILVDNLDEALNIDRSSFRETEPSFVALRDAIHSYLSKTVFPGIKYYSSDERTTRRDEVLRRDKQILQRIFRSLDKTNRKVVFGPNQASFVERTQNEISLALSLKEKPGKVSPQFHRIVGFLEAYLMRKLAVRERDELYSALYDWLKEFE